MLEYKPKFSPENYNVPKQARSEFKFFTFLFNFLIITVGLYFFLGLIFDLLVPYISPIQEKKFWKDYYLNYVSNPKKLDDKSAKAISLQKLVDKLESHLPKEQQELKLKVYIQNSNEVNAFAVAGGYIIVLNGLLKKVESENELAYVLAHEIGHFAHKDQLKDFGRSFILLFISQAFFGQDNPINKLSNNFFSLSEKRFSQSQEIDADLFALQLLDKTYNHIGGCTDFMQRLQKDSQKETLNDFFSTHPHPKKRVEIMNKMINEGNYYIGAKSPLSFD